MRRLLLVAMVVATVAGCSRCGAKKAPAQGGPQLLALLPNDAPVLVAPDLGVFGEKVAKLQNLKSANFVAQLQGFGSAAELVTAAVTASGIDFRSADALRHTGIAPDKGFAATLRDDENANYAVVGVDDGERLVSTLETLARNRMGATTRSNRAENGLTITTFDRPGQKTPAMSVVLLGQYAVFGSQVDPAVLRAAAGIDPAHSLAQAPGLVAALRRLGGPGDLYLHNPVSGARKRLGPRGATATLALDKEGVLVRADFPENNPLGALLTPQADAADLAAVVPRDAFLFVRFLGDPNGAGALWRSVTSPGLRDVFVKGGVDVEKDIFANLRSGAVASLSLAPNATLGAGMPTLDVRRTNPFRYFQLVAASAVKTPETVDPVLEKLAALGPSLNMAITKNQVDGKTVFQTTYAMGEGASFARDGKVVVTAAPLGRLKNAFKAVETAPAASPKGAPLTATLDLKKLADEVRALPSEAWGVGGFAIKATALRWLDVTSDLTALEATAASNEGATEVSVRLKMTLP